MPHKKESVADVNKSPEKDIDLAKDSPVCEDNSETEESLSEADEKYSSLFTQYEELKNQTLRVMAEYDNFRKRSQRERELLFGEIKAETIGEFLPIFDNLDRALRTETSDEAYKKGVELTMRQLRDIFEKLGVEEIKAEGEPFDPAFHNAVMHIEDESLGKNVIAEVFQPGFKMGDRIIRFSMVKVAN